MQKIVTVASVNSTGEDCYVILQQQSSGHVLDSVDATFKADTALAADSDAYNDLPELMIGALPTQIYQFVVADDPTKPWKSDYYNFIAYRRIGLARDSSSDEIVGTGVLVVQNDKILEQFHSYSGV